MIWLKCLRFPAAKSYRDWVTLFWKSYCAEGSLLLQCLSSERIQIIEFYGGSVEDA